MTTAGTMVPTPLHPGPMEVHCWIEELAIQLAPSSIANAVSHLRLYLQIRESTSTVLSHITVALAMNAVRRSKSHVPRSSPHIPIQLHKQAVTNLAHSPATWWCTSLCL